MCVYVARSPLVLLRPTPPPLPTSHILSIFIPTLCFHTLFCSLVLGLQYLVPPEPSLLSVPSLYFILPTVLSSPLFFSSSVFYPHLSLLTLPLIPPPFATHTHVHFPSLSLALPPASLPSLPSWSHPCFHQPSHFSSFSSTLSPSSVSSPHQYSILSSHSPLSFLSLSPPIHLPQSLRPFPRAVKVVAG